MRRAKVRNSILAASGTLAYLAAIVAFDLGCGGDSADPSVAVATVRVDPSARTLVVGTTVQLSARTLGSHDEDLARSVTWSSSDVSVASVSTAGLVTGVAAGGPVTITATSEGRSGSAQITVTPVPVASVTVSGAASVRLGHDAPFTAVLKDANGATLTGRLVTWTSSQPSVASVGFTSGVATGVSVGGPATITATSEGVSGSAQISVLAPAVATVTVLPGAPSIPVNGTVTLTATPRDEDGNVLTGRAITWASSTPNFAPVSATGVVTGVAVGGPYSITATIEGQSGLAFVTVTPSLNPVVLTGRVIDFTTQTGIAGASVRFLEGFNLLNVLGGTTTAADGTFTSPSLIAAGGFGVMIEASATGFVTGRVLVVDVPAGQTISTPPVPLVPLSANPGGIAGTVLNARTGQGIAGAVVDLYNNTSSGGVLTTTADANGVFTFSGLSAGTYRLVGSKVGFTTAQRVGVAVGNNAITSNQDVVLSPTGTNDIRIVLTWGAAPSDLDSHLTGPNADATRFHVFYSSRGSTTAAPFAFLDIDDVSSFGPETITITQFNSGNYRYSVHDYSNRSSSTSTALGSSGAKVEVYTSTGLVQTFFVPNQAGTLWTVFEMTGNIASPVITPRNQMGLANDPSTILSPPADGSTRATDGALIGRVVQQHPKAKPR